MRIVCGLPFVMKWALTALLLGFAAGFYLGLGAAPTDAGTPVPVIDQSMEPRHLPVPAEIVTRSGPEIAVSISAVIGRAPV